MFRLELTFLFFCYIYIYLYTNREIMVETKLTTVKILKNVYSKFKRLSFESDITLQKLVNRAVDKYVEDEDFRNEINDYTLLEVSGSQY